MAMRPYPSDKPLQAFDKAAFIELARMVRAGNVPVGR